MCIRDRVSTQSTGSSLPQRVLFFLSFSPLFFPLCFSLCVFPSVFFPLCFFPLCFSLSVFPSLCSILSLLLLSSLLFFSLLFFSLFSSRVTPPSKMNTINLSHL
eukprot:TRINITY_DN164_c0_g8_i1.p2 TRINITY_DN164_c0_g8~~TRINITY_DN164_c0_g8_i1.p2  ORF type:complete len:104 (-),score=34.85 TRINITY_DN164_c0_g8_i1:156-467(-)